MAGIITVFAHKIDTFEEIAARNIFGSEFLKAGREGDFNERIARIEYLLALFAVIIGTGIDSEGHLFHAFFRFKEGYFCGFIGIVECPVPDAGYACGDNYFGNVGILEHLNGKDFNSVGNSERTRNAERNKSKFCLPGVGVVIEQCAVFRAVIYRIIAIHLIAGVIDIDFLEPIARIEGRTRTVGALITRENGEYAVGNVDNLKVITELEAAAFDAHNGQAVVHGGNGDFPEQIYTFALEYGICVLAGIVGVIYLHIFKCFQPVGIYGYRLRSGIGIRAVAFGIRILITQAAAIAEPAAERLGAVETFGNGPFELFTEANGLHHRIGTVAEFAFGIGNDEHYSIFIG